MTESKVNPFNAFIAEHGKNIGYTINPKNSELHNSIIDIDIQTTQEFEVFQNLFNVYNS